MNIEIKNEAVSKDGEAIGTIQEGTCYLTKEIGPTVKAAINSEHGDKLKFVVGPLAPVEGPTGNDGPVGNSGEEGEKGPDDSTLEAPSGPQVTETVSCSAEPMPERDPVLGAKCPKLIAWKAKQKGGE